MPRQIVHTGRKITVALDTETKPDGTVIRRDAILHPGAVVILPLVDAEHVCLLRNHRFIMDEVLWELPAGTLEPGEAPELAAVRELAEETGYHAASWRKLTAFYPSPGVLNEVLHLFVAEGLTAGEARPEADEELQAHTVPFTRALEWVLDGTINDGKTIIGLLWWERLRMSRDGQPH